MGVAMVSVTPGTYVCPTAGNNNAFALNAQEIKNTADGSDDRLHKTLNSGRVFKSQALCQTPLSLDRDGMVSRNLLIKLINSLLRWFAALNSYFQTQVGEIRFTSVFPNIQHSP